MTLSSITRAAAACLTVSVVCMTLLAPTAAEARAPSGSTRSAGNGMKCYTTTTYDPNTGVPTYQRVCYKSG